MYIICPAQSILEAYSNGPVYKQQVASLAPPSSPPPPRHNGREQSAKVATQDRARKPSPQPAGTAMGHEPSLRGLAHPAVWPGVKNHINTSIQLVKNLTDFSQELSQMYEHHAEELQLLVANYRKKNAELRKERPGGNCMLEVWESMLQGVEADSAGHGEVAAVLSRQVSRQTLEKSFYRKLQARKLIQHRESLDQVVTKAEDTLTKCRQEYKSAYLAASQNPSSSAALAAYLDAHNTYVTQLHATNAIVDNYAKETLPDILQELEDVYADLCKTMADSLAHGAEIISNRMGSQSRRWCSLWSECKAVDPSSDTASLIRNSNVPAQAHPSHRLRLFTPPQEAVEPGRRDGRQEVAETAPQLRNELVTDRLASLQVAPRYEALCEEASQLQLQAQQLQDSLATMLRLQQRSLESQLFNKANELQEDISKKRYELKSMNINMAANRAQRELFSSKLEMADGPHERKMSSASTVSMKSKWLKAFKSLKTPPPNPTAKELDKDKRDTKDVPAGDSAHQFQEYTYKKITPCDVCSQVLRGHTRQGLKCRLCKLNVHIDCQERVGRCQTKSRLLRRQKSSSEIETRVTPPQPTAHSNSDVEQGGGEGHETRRVSPELPATTLEPRSPDLKSRSVTFRTPDADCPVSYEVPSMDSTYHVLKTANELSGPGAKASLRRPQPSAHSTSSEYAGLSHARRSRRIFGMKSFMFGHRSHERASSLPETEESNLEARSRPFGQPLVLSSPTTPDPPVRQ